MNYERSRHESESSSNFADNRVVENQNKTKNFPSGELADIKRSIDNHQSTSLHQPLLPRKQHFHLSYFVRGIFWGAIVSWIALVSAGFGMALTRIDVVEQMIASRIGVDAAEAESTFPASLTRPVNILLIELEPDTDGIVKFSRDFVGSNKTILVLKLNPQKDLAEAITIPTDSKVKIPGFGWGTIADANKYGGTELVIQMVKQLMNGATIDRYIRGTPKTFERLTATGKLKLENCNREIQDCQDQVEQIIRQEDAFIAIRQRFNIPNYLADFETRVIEVKPKLDTNISLLEIMSLVNFIKELPPDRISVSLLPNYTSGRTIGGNAQSDRLETQHSLSLEHQANHIDDPITYKWHGHSTPLDRAKHPPAINKTSKQQYLSPKLAIAVQNTTDDPELGIRIVAYLRQKNWQNVYLIEHIPLKLSKTKIVVDHSQLNKASQLKKSLTFGTLQPQIAAKQKKSQPRELILQIGEDANFFLE